MAWDGANFQSMEEVRSFPIKTSLCYIKLKHVKPQPVRDCLMLSHKIELVGDRAYLLSGSVSHSAFPPQKGTQRIESPFSFNYFEPSYDGTGVKNIYICQTNPKVLQAQLLNPSRAGSIANLRKLLTQRQNFEINTAYLPKAGAERLDGGSPDLIAPTFGEFTPQANTTKTTEPGKEINKVKVDTDEEDNFQSGSSDHETFPDFEVNAK